MNNLWYNLYLESVPQLLHVYLDYHTSLIPRPSYLMGYPQNIKGLGMRLLPTTHVYTVVWFVVKFSLYLMILYL